MERDEYRGRYLIAVAEVRFKRLESGRYVARCGGQVIAEIDKTGTHLDNWPWQVIAHFDVQRKSNGLPGMSGTNYSTYRDAKEAVLDAWVRREPVEAIRS